jgi:hypothetical protein
MSGNDSKSPPAPPSLSQRPDQPVLFEGEDAAAEDLRGNPIRGPTKRGPRGKLISASVRKPRGRPFQQGNPGRPRGSKNRITAIVEQITEEHTREIIEQVLEQARGGDVSCQKMILDRVWPLRKGQPINIELSPINSSRDLLSAIGSVWTAIGRGLLTPDEVTALSLAIDRSAPLIELQDIEKRLAALEAAREKTR